MTLSEKKDIKFCACKRQYWTEFYSNRRIQYMFLASPSSFQVLFFRLSLLLLRYDLLGEIKYLK